MSEQTVTDEDVQQTDVRGFLRKMKKGEPLNVEATTQLLNRIFNILEGLAGEGCTVEKPLDREGLGWRVVVDGVHSDLEPMGHIPMPFELVSADNAWHVWLKDAEVVLNNFHATRASNLTLDASGCYSAAAFGAGSGVYLYVYGVADDDGTRHGGETYVYDVSTSVPTGALASIQLGLVRSANLAVQYQRGNQVFYTFADSEIITHDALNAVVHVVTDSASASTPAFDEHWGLVLRNGGVIKYYKAADLLKVAFKTVQDILREEPDPETDPSEILPIGDETYDEWEARIKEAIRECLVNDGWPYMPEFSGESIWPGDDSEDFDYFGGWGVYDGIADRFSSYWRGINDGVLREAHLPARTDLNEILRLMQAIEDALDALEEDPDGQGPEKSDLQTLRDKVAEVEGRVAGLRTHLAQVQGYVEGAEDRIETIQELAAENQARYAALQTRQAAIDADVTDLENRTQ